MKRILVVMLLVTISVEVFSAKKNVSRKKTVAEKQEKVLAPEYKSYIVGDSKGNIYMSENEKEMLPLASTTKVMTMIVTFDAISKGKVSLNDDIVISPEATSVKGTTIPLKAGDTFKLSELIKAAAIQSANNASYAIAEHVGQGRDNFIKLMNEKAKSLGLENQVEYHTPSGLPPHMTKRKMDKGTAYAMYKIMLEANKYPEYVKIAGMKSLKIKEEKISLKNNNKLLGKKGIFGLKTGYHVKAGFNILVMNENEDIDAFYVLLGGRSAAIRDRKVLELDEVFHTNFVYKKIINEEKSLASVTVKKGLQPNIELYPDRNYEHIIKSNDKVNIVLERVKELEAPVLKNMDFGNYKVIINGEEILTGKLVVKNSVEKKGIIDKISEII
ncbi:MAG: D-alanyl-D-alanine carboxypeptidase family protein [Fusobacteriaceae bacterium]